jgi:hypothetical protein
VNIRDQGTASRCLRRKKGSSHARHSLSRHRHWRIFRHRTLSAGLRQLVRRLMFFEYALGAIAALGILFYLVYALLRPQNF